jgi:predicted metal-dependent phosphoesterase TrpH
MGLLPKKLSRADLHVRTVASMGTFRPAEAVALAKEKGISAIAIVDRDCIEGIPQAMDASEKCGVEVIPGVELAFGEQSREVHIIGYYIDWRNKFLLRELSRMQTMNAFRVQRTLDKLEAAGIFIRYGDVTSELGEASIIGTVHVAEAIARKGFASSPAEAFSKFLAQGKVGHTPRYYCPASEGLPLIAAAGGVPALAHPKANDTYKLVHSLIEYGLQAIEVCHPTHTPSDTENFKRVAKKYGLVEVGGSDSPYPRRDVSPVGGVTVPYTSVENLKRAHKKRMPSDASKGSAMPCDE